MSASKADALPLGDTPMAKLYQRDVITCFEHSKKERLMPKKLIAVLPANSRKDSFIEFKKELFMPGRNLKWKITRYIRQRSS